MGIMERSLKSLLPNSWTITGDLLGIIEALAVSFERIRVFLKAVETEKEPGTADEFLPEWYAQLGLKYDSTQTLAQRRAKAKQVYSSTGGQDPNYLNQQVQIAYPYVFIEYQEVDSSFMAGSGMAGLMMATDYPSYYPDPIPVGADALFYYRVYGEVDQVTDLLGVQNILSRIMPVPYEPIFAVTIRSITPRADAGLGMAGLMMSGRSA